MDSKFNLYGEKKRKINQLCVGIDIFKEILKKNQIERNQYYKLWQKKFIEIYNKNNLIIELYLYFSLIYYLGFLIISKFFLGDKLIKKDEIFSQNYFLKIQDDFSQNNAKINLFNLNYFNPILKLDSKAFNKFIYILLDIIQLFDDLDINPEYYFDFLVQNIIPKEIRHDSGEFYTPPFLVQKMADFSYELGEKVLDPCCGSGNFLIIILKKILNSNLPENRKIHAIDNLYGFDINPISIYMAKINFLLLLGKKFRIQKINIFNINSLCPDSNFKNVVFDLIIGNPPWYTFRDIDSIKQREFIKYTAEKFKIKPTPKNLLNTEISTVFFYSSYENYMKLNSKIFFVITKGVITGSHTSRFRNFRGFDLIKIWNFNNSLKKVFPVDFICLFAKKSNNTNPKIKIEIPCYNFSLVEKYNKINYFKDLQLKLESKEILVPYNRIKKGEKTFTKKLISKREKKALLEIRESIYKPLFRKGADLNPRNLIFVNINPIGNSLVKINPDERIFKRAKHPWKNKEFKDEIVDENNIFKVVKSTELLKFFIYDFYNVFLPIMYNDLKFNYNNLNRYSKTFYNKINQIYLKLKKSTTNNQSIMDNLNRWGKLQNNQQLEKIKIVYNNSGAILKSAVIQGDYIISGDLSYYSTKDLDEAYYLSAVLNSKLFTNQIRIIKSSRHIFKKPFSFPIKKFIPQNINHQKLANLGKKGEKEAKIIFNNFGKNNRKFSYFSFKEILNIKINQILDEIDNIVKVEFSS